MHVIIGKGNIGTDLKLDLERHGMSAVILTRSEGFEYPRDFTRILDMDPECVWVPAGAGSVSEAKHNFEDVVRTHVLMPLDLLRKLPPKVGVVLFSSDYAADESYPSDPTRSSPSPRSLYAMTKIWMEQGARLISRPNGKVIRVGSVYGRHFYDKTFPGKLHDRFPNPCTVELPSNMVVPTPSEWISQVLVRNYQKLMSSQDVVHHVAPRGCISVHQWGKKILGEDYKIQVKGVDVERPTGSALGCTLEDPPHWEDLWNSPWWGERSRPGDPIRPYNGNEILPVVDG